jgi:site-specific DNA recombinase
MTTRRRSNGKPRVIHAAAYCRKSTERGLEQDFNTIDAQREACAAYILSQKVNGWVAVDGRYEDGGFSGGNTDRPAWQRLMADVEAGKVDLIVVTRADRLTRSLRDFIQIIDFLDKHGASFVSVSESFDTSTPSGRAFLHSAAGSGAGVFRCSGMTRSMGSSWSMRQRPSACV